MFRRRAEPDDNGRASLAGVLRVVVHPGATVGEVWVPAWVEVRVGPIR